MESTINERLKKSIELKKINPPDIYSKIGTSRQTWGGWLNQNRAIPLDKLVKIIKMIPDIDARWLLTGQRQSVSSSDEIPEMLEEEQAEYKKDCCKLCKEKDERIAELKDHIASLKNQLNAKKETSASNSVQHGQFANESKAS